MSATPSATPAAPAPAPGGGAPRVVVLGGGVLGASIAVHLLRGGADVTLLTEAGPVSGASGRSLSWLNSAGARSAAYHRLRLAGLERYRALLARGPERDWLRFDGGLRWSGDAAAERERHEHERAAGYPSELLDPGQVAQRAPGVDPAAVGGAAVLNEAEGWVSLPHLVAELLAEFHRDGGRLATGAGRCSLLVEDGRAAGAVTGGGEVVRAGAVVVACGAATPAVLAPHGVRIPDASPLSALVVTAPVADAPRLVLNTPRAALRPNPGGTLAVDHDWFEDRIAEEPDGTCSLPDDVVAELLGEASAVLAAHPALEAASVRAGRKPVPADGEPVLGEVAEVPGCFAAFTHSGATLALVVGELLAQEVLTGEPSPLLAGFRPSRFA